MAARITGVSFSKPRTVTWARLCAAFLAGTLAASATLAEPGQGKAAAPAATAPSPKQHKASPYHAVGMVTRAKDYYRSVWGVDNFLVRRTASNNLIRFSYRVTDAERAKVLEEKEATPHLIDPARGVILQVPDMENIGQLRQTGPPVVGKEYWMVFSNKGDFVKAGDRVDVLIGTFHADGLVVE